MPAARAQSLLGLVQQQRCLGFGADAVFHPAGGFQAEAARMIHEALDLATASSTIDDHDALFFGTAMAGVPGMEAEAERFLRQASDGGSAQARSALDALLARQSASDDEDLQTSG